MFPRGTTATECRRGSYAERERDKYIQRERARLRVCYSHGQRERDDETQRGKVSSTVHRGREKESAS